MARRCVDLSIPLETGVESDPEPMLPKIEYFDHHQTFAGMEASFPGLKREQLPEGQSWAVEHVRISTHNGTHMDAPWHFHATQDASLPGGPRPSLTIDQTPLDWCLRPGVKLALEAFEPMVRRVFSNVRRSIYKKPPVPTVEAEIHRAAELA